MCPLISHHTVLKECYVRHSHQRRGLGAALVAWGCRKADESGLLAYCEASPEGLNLYKRHGFREVDRVTVDLEPWGGNKGEFHSYGLLVREKITEREHNIGVVQDD